MFRILIAAILFSSVGFLYADAVQARKFRPKEIVQWQDALKRLKKGNERYISMARLKDRKTSLYARKYLSKGQWPFATILCCSDSRVSPEIIFDSGQGDLFVIRVAGNVMDSDLLGSIEYASLHSTSHLIIVMGHQFCGAVNAAVHYSNKPDIHETPGIKAIINQIIPAVLQAKQKTGLSGEKLTDAAARENVKMVSRSILKNSEALTKLSKEGKVKIVNAYFMISEGRVEFLKEK